MKKLLIFTILIVGISYAAVSMKFKSSDSSETNNSQQQTEEPESDQEQTSEESQKLVVSEAELAKLKLQGVVSPDERYYIKNTAPFPRIVSLLAVGEEYAFRPDVRITKISRLTWSGDGSRLAYLYQVQDADYLNMDILNTAKLSEVIDGEYRNGQRVLAAGAKMDYGWIDSDRILYYELQNYDSDKKFYRNANINIYDSQADLFEYPYKSTDFLENIYSIQLSPKNGKFLYVQAVLSDSGSTIGQQYVTARIDGTVLNRTDNYNANWSK